jgi:hypothetical protein
LCDFAENYYFVLQDKAQGKWNNAQATIHQFVIFFEEIRCFKYRAWESSNDIRLFDALFHFGTYIQRHLMKFIETTFESPLNKMVYFSDGSAAQYKNRKNVLNITCRNRDFVVPAEWHFYVTSHGKNACDGFGGTLRTLASKANLQQQHN